LREATLNGLPDLDTVRPRKPRTPAAKAGKPNKGKAMGARLRRLRSRVLLVVGSAGFSAIMVGIICNAVMFQKGHHPAPLFSTAAPAVEARPPAARVAAAPAPVAPPATDAAPAPALTDEAPSVAAPVRRAAHIPAAPPAHHVATAKVDGISHLLGRDKTDGAAPVHHATRVRPGQRHDVAAKTSPKAAETTVARTNGPLDLIAKKIRAMTALASKDHPAATN
jgi:hypothetical protein